MIKKILIGIAVLVVFLLVFIIAAPFFLPLNLIKDFATEKIGDAINREVKVKSISFNIFKGFDMKGLYIGNRKGFSKAPFIAADSIELKYSFWSLFAGKVIINEASLINPHILIEQTASGATNYDDLISKKPKPKKAKPKKKDKKAKKPPVSLFVSKFSIKNGRLILKNPAGRNEIKGFNLSVSGLALVTLKPAKIDASATILYQGKSVPVSFSSRVGINLPKKSIHVPSLVLSIAGEKLSLKADISKLDTGPHISFAASSGRFSVEPFAALFAGGAKVKKEKLPYGALTRQVNKSLASIPPSLIVNGTINIANLSFSKLNIDKIALKLSLANKIASLTIDEINGYGGTLTAKAIANLKVSGIGYQIQSAELAGFSAGPFTNAVADSFLSEFKWGKGLKDKIEGTLAARLKAAGKGVEPQDVLGNLQASATFSLKKGKVRNPQSLAKAADQIGWPGLKADLTVSELKGAATIINQVIDVKNLSLDDTEIKIRFKGGLDLKNQKYVPGNTLSLILAPSVTKTLPEQFRVLADQKGYTYIDLELKGSLKLPIPIIKLERQVEIGKKKITAKIEAKKIELQKEAEKKVEEKKEQLQEDVKEEAKKKLKELFKF